jgi:hypothetical protein
MLKPDHLLRESDNVDPVRMSDASDPAEKLTNWKLLQGLSTAFIS